MLFPLLAVARAEARATAGRIPTEDTLRQPAGNGPPAVVTIYAAPVSIMSLGRGPSLCTRRYNFLPHPGCGAVWLARLTGGQEVGSSNLPSPTGITSTPGVSHVAGSLRHPRGGPFTTPAKTCTKPCPPSLCEVFYVATTEKVARMSGAHGSVKIFPSLRRKNPRRCQLTLRAAAVRAAATVD